MKKVYLLVCSSITIFLWFEGLLELLGYDKNELFYLFMNYFNLTAHHLRFLYIGFLIHLYFEFLSVKLITAGVLVGEICLVLVKSWTLQMLSCYHNRPINFILKYSIHAVKFCLMLFKRLLIVVIFLVHVILKRFQLVFLSTLFINLFVQQVNVFFTALVSNNLVKSPNYCLSLF